jgi:hypothetical protein
VGHFDDQLGMAGDLGAELTAVDAACQRSLGGTSGRGGAGLLLFKMPVSHESLKTETAEDLAARMKAARCRRARSGGQASQGERARRRTMTLTATRLPEDSPCSANQASAVGKAQSGSEKFKDQMTMRQGRPRLSTSS